MKTVGNVLWFVCAGLWSALVWVLVAALCAVTVIGLPVARQCLKLGRFSLWPMGRQVVDDPAATKLSTVGNALWFVPGTILAVIYIIGGALLCVTVIGIPFGMQSFKFAGLAFSPFGKKVVRSKDLAASVA